MWFQGEEEEEDEDLMLSPALLARRASESWINTPPVEVKGYFVRLGRDAYQQSKCREFS